jgi:hypothetical protein
MQARPLLATALLALLAACGSDAEATNPSGGPTSGDAPTETVSGTPVSGVWLVAGDDIDAAPRERIAALLGGALGKPVSVTNAAALPTTLTPDALVLAIGSSELSRSLVPDAERAKLAPEAFVVRSGTHRGATLLVAHGNPKAEHPHGNIGALHGAYVLLEELGFAFLHPLAPTTPTRLVLPSQPLDRSSAPRWSKRALHIHTQHPLELTDMLQGFGPGGPADEQGFTKSLAEWDRFLEWAVANGQNGVEWFMLWADSWKDFADSPARIQRLGRLVDRAHAFGIDAGIDAPIAFAQQHSFRLLRTQGDPAAELAEIRTRLDWLMGARFDFLGIEAGTSEFTHPTPERMLAWMNEVAKHLDEKHGGTRAYIKVHCSTGQTADGYTDPETGQPINFNMLPHFADKRLGVLPHTVQHYGLNDPAPTYGNTDFAYMRSFTESEAGSRPVVYYPESAYWVSFDVDVPLFLPLYADRRLSDLRVLAKDEDLGKMGRGAHAGAHMDGQLVFSSGWEWGYWLNDVIAARAAWQPATGATQEEALENALAPVTRVFGKASAEVSTWISDVAHAEQALLIEGKISGNAPSTVVQRNGQAYLQGSETWDDVSKLAQSLPTKAAQMTQPDKLGLVDMRNPLHGGPGYSAEVEPLLAEMETTFAALATRGDALRAKVPANARDLIDDLADAMQMTALRAKQVHGLYDYVDGYWDTARTARLPRLAAARSALDAAKLVVDQREKHYRVPAERIAGWRSNPTAYEYGYLWSVRSLYYWWRDEGKAVDAPIFPCYLNVVNPVDVAFGEGIGADAARLFGSLLSSDQSRGCLAEPASEPKFPQDGLRTRP